MQGSHCIWREVVISFVEQMLYPHKGFDIVGPLVFCFLFLGQKHFVAYHTKDLNQTRLG